MWICLLTLGMALAGPAIAGSVTESALTATAVVRVDTRSGRLVRQIVTPNAEEVSTSKSLAAGLREKARVDDLAIEAARKYGVDPLLVLSVIEVESDFNPFALSIKGAEGLMQLTPGTARRLGVENSFSPGENIDAGVRYLKYLQDLFQNDRLALAAYNAGEGAVVKHGWIPPYPETQRYVERVEERYAELKKQANLQGVSVSSEEKEPMYRPVEAFVDAEGKLHLRTR